jgi:hypothetical protein
LGVRRAVISARGVVVQNGRVEEGGLQAQKATIDAWSNALLYDQMSCGTARTAVVSMLSAPGAITLLLQVRGDKWLLQA